MKEAIAAITNFFDNLATVQEEETNLALKNVKGQIVYVIERFEAHSVSFHVELNK